MWPFTQIANLFRKPPELPPKLEYTYEQSDFLSDNERTMCLRETCPDCGTVDKFIAGPTGGLSANFYCGNIQCGSRFNAIFPFGVQRISAPCPLAPKRTPAPESSDFHGYRGS